RSDNTTSVIELVNQFPEFQLICNSSNLGFTGGMNIGLKSASGDYVLLVEDDIIVHSKCIEHLVKCLSEDPSVGLASGLMYNRGDRKIRCAGGTVSLGSTYQKTVFGAGETDQGQFQEPFNVNYIPGAFMMARTHVLRRLGGFRDSFFMYFEDTELCLRAKKRGYQIKVVPSAKVQHWEPYESAADDYIDMHRFKN